MLVVVVDTSTPAVTAGLVRVVGTDGTVDVVDQRVTVDLVDQRVTVDLVDQRVTVDARAHGELLAPAIDAVLTSAGVSVRDLAAMVAGLGPGPFTGLRVGLVTAAAIGQALGIPTYGVCSLDSIGASTTGVTLVATDARRKEVYWAVYQDGGRLVDPAVNRPEELPGILAELGVAPTVAVGDGALRYPQALALPVLDEPRFPSVRLMAVLAADRITSRAAGETLTPLYLRRPDAVEPAARKAVRQ